MQQLQECDYCERVDELRKVGDSVVCPDHANEPLKKFQVKTVDAAPINVNEVLRQSKAIDTTLQTRADVFNARTMSIADINKAIDADPAITNKPWAKAEQTQERINRLKQVIFDLNQTIVDRNSELRAEMQSLNNLANTLRAEEREKLRLQDVNYKPRDLSVKMPVNAKTLKITRKRIDKAELREAARKLNLPEYSISLVITQKNFTVAQAVEFFEKQFAEMRAKTSANTQTTSNQ